MRHNTHPEPSPRYSPCDSVCAFPPLKVRDFLFAHSHPRPLQRLPRGTAPAFRLHHPFRPASRLPPTSPSLNCSRLPSTPPSPNLLCPLLHLPHRTAPASPRSPSPPPSPPLPRLPHRTAPASTQLPSTTLPLDRSCPAPIPLVPSPPEPTHDLARTPAFGFSGGLFHILGSLIPSLKILGIIPKKQTYKRALQRIYLERGSVHACILLCTRGYTVVYTRVYSSPLGRRYSLGISRLGHGYFHLRRILLHDLALAL